MKVAASSICWRFDNLDGAMSKAKAAGFEWFEPLTFPKEIWDLHGDLRTMSSNDLKARFDAHGLKPAALHLGAIMTPTEEKRRALIDYAKRALEVAHDIGCPMIVEGGPDRGVQPFVPFLRSLKEIIPVAEAAGVKIALENHWGNWIQFIQDYEHIFEHFDSPAVGVTLDTGHFHAAGVDSVEVAKRFGPRVIHVHMKDHKGHESVALGDGDIDNAAVIRELKKSGYDGCVSEELELKEKSAADQAAFDGFAYLSKLIAD